MVALGRKELEALAATAQPAEALRHLMVQAYGGLRPDELSRITRRDTGGGRLSMSVKTAKAGRDSVSFRRTTT